MKKHFLFLFFSFAFVFSCKKDLVEPLAKEGKTTISSIQGGKKVNIEKAKEIYNRAFGNQNAVLPRGLFETFAEDKYGAFEPIWFLAKEVQVLGEGSIVTVPTKTPNGMSLAEGRGIQWVFFASDSCVTPMELVIYEAQDPTKLDNCSFSGPIAAFNFCDCSAFKYYIENGNVEFSEEITESDLPQLNGATVERDDPDDEGCDYGGGGGWLGRLFDFLGDLFSNIGNWFGNTFGGNNGNNEDNNYWNGGGAFPDYFNYYGNPGSGGGGGSPAVMNSIFDGTFFNGQGQSVLNSMNSLIEQYDLFVCVEDLHIALYHCIATNYNDPEDQCGGFHEGIDDPNENPNIDELTIPEYLIFLYDLGTRAPDCLYEMQQNYQEEINMGPGDGELACLIQGFNDFGIPDDVVFELIQQNGCYVNGFLNSECVEEALVSYIINQFLDNENYSEEATLAANALQQIQANSNGELTVAELLSILNAFELYFDNPVGNEEALVNTLRENGVNPLSTNTHGDALIEETAPSPPPSTPVTPMTPDVFWQKAGSIKQSLINQFPSQTQRINDLFPCWVLGPALEEAALNSFGIPKNEKKAYSRTPDGWLDQYIIDGIPPFYFPISIYQPVLIEIKGRFGSTFDYSGQQGQLGDYLQYLKVEAYADNTIMHGLYLVLPDGVTLGQNIINNATSNNVPILHSTVELVDNNVDNFRVKPLDVVNISSLDRSGHLFSFLSDGFFNWGIRNLVEDELDYNTTEIDFQKQADKFKNSVLIPNEPASCPED